jgi:hypothetical protein
VISTLGDTRDAIAFFGIERADILADRERQFDVQKVTPRGSAPQADNAYNLRVTMSGGEHDTSRSLLLRCRPLRDFIGTRV